MRSIDKIPSCLLLSATLFGMSALGDSSDPHYLISKTSQIIWSKEVSFSSLPLLSFNTVILDLNFKDDPKLSGKMTVIRTKPLLFANSKDVKKSWDLNLKSFAKVSKSKTIKNEGCRELSAGRFSCVRYVQAPSGEFSADEMIWNRNRDVIEINFGSASSQEIAMNRIRATKIEFMDSSP